MLTTNIFIITSRVSRRGYKNGAVCVCVCLCVGTTERIDVQSQNFVQRLTLMTSRGSLMVKVKGQGHPVVLYLT